VTLCEVLPPTAALTDEAESEALGAFLLGNVASKRFTHQRRHGNTLAARKGMELVVHRFFDE